MPTPTDGESRCPRCGQPIPGGQAGDVCPRCLAEVFLKVDFDEEGDEAPLAAAGEKVGRYRIADVLGEGGFGVVYRAVEDGPLRREVALKLVKPGMDSRAVLARFDAEQRALGMLDHPNVARVLEAGMTEEGRPYFAMELIEGEPLNRFCASRELNLEQRLRVFLQVCSGVEHAHAKGLIHRDLKPSNVLVAPTANDEPRAVIIDFGIAKALWEELTPDTLYTSPRQMLGTPEYMSPEQASRGGLDVDTRADVYSLGALLYELVTGAPPLRAEDLRRASMLEWLRLIEEKDPVKPSKRMLETSEVTTSAMRRRAREELDWVVLKALSKERARRYQTVRELEEDVEHFLRHEPVRARPPSAAYAVRKWMRRHRALAVAGAVALVSLMAAVVVSAVMRSRAVEAETRTRQAFSVADERVAAEEVEDAFGHAVARLCRALRTDPENRSARYRLLVLLAGGSSGVLDAPMMTHEEPVSWAHMLPPDGGEVLTATSRDGTIHHWRTGGGQTQKLRNYTLPGRIKAQAVTADGARLLNVTGWEGGSVGRVWDLGSGGAVTEEFRLAEESDFVNQAAFFPDGRGFAAVTQGGSVGVWDAGTGGVRWRAEFPEHGAALAVSVSSDGRLLAVGWQDKTMSLHDAADGRELWRRELLCRAVTGEALMVGASERKDARVVSADGRVAAVWSEPGQVEVVDLEKWRVMCRIPTVGRDAWLRLSADGARLLVAERGAEEARLFDAGDGTLLESWRPEAGALTFADLTADGGTMVTGHADGAVVLKSPGTGEVRRFEMEQAVLHVAVSPDGRRAVGSTLRADLMLWDLEAEKEIVPEDGPPRHLDAGYAGIGIQSRFSADGRRLFTWFSEDKAVRIFSAETGAPEGEPLLHEDTVTTVVESPDGRLLLTKDDRERLYLWDLERRLLINEVADFSNELARIAFSPSGARVLVAGMAGTVQIWQHPPQDGPPLPECFLRFAEGMGLWRLSGDERVFERVRWSEFEAARKEVLALPNDACDPRTLRWMKWIASDPGERGVRPE